MILHYQLRKEDLLAFNREYQMNSPLYLRMRTRLRLIVPLVLACCWGYFTYQGGIRWIFTGILFIIAVISYLLHPLYLDYRMMRYAAKRINQTAYRNTLGPRELTLSESGLHAKSSSGETTYYWSAVDKVRLTKDYLFIFANAAGGFPIPITDVGVEAAGAAYEYAMAHATLPA